MINQLGSLADIATGKLDANAAVKDGQYPFFTCNEKPYRINKWAFDADAILVSGNGSQVGHVNRYSGKFNAYQRTYVITNPKIVSIPYLYYYLKCFLRSYIDSGRRGSSIPYITIPMLRNLPIYIPNGDISSIQRVAELTSDYISYLNNSVTLLQKTISFLYSYWFVQFDFPDENGRPYKSSGGKMIYNEQLKQEIPDGWECKKLTDLFNFVRGTEVGSDAYADKKISDDYIHFWRVRDVGDDCKTWVDGNMGNLTIVKPGDVVITLDGTVGKIGINLDGAISGGLRHAVDHTSTISSVAIYAILQSDYVQESLRQYVRGRGSILAHASGALQHLAIPYDKDIFNMFQDIIQPMFDLMVNCKEESKQLASLRDWLLPMLMNGQVKIGEQSKQPHTDRSIERTENDK